MKAYADIYHILGNIWHFQMNPVFPELPHQRALQQKYEFLVDNVGVSDVIDKLFQEGWISIDEKEIIEELRGERQRTRKLLDKLITKPRAAFEVLLAALKNAKADHVVQALSEKLAEIHRENEGKQYKLVEYFLDFLPFIATKVSS